MYYFCNNLINNDMRIGDAFYQARLNYHINHGLSRGICVYNLLGDPSLTLTGIEDRPGGTDTLIHQGGYYTYAADSDIDGVMFVAVVMSGRRDIKTYKSSDHGNTWQHWATFESEEDVRSIDLIVNRSGSGELKDDRVLVFYVTPRVIRVARFPMAGGLPERRTISGVGSNAIIWSLCASKDPVPRDGRLYLAFSWETTPTADYHVSVCRSISNGDIWQDLRSYQEYMTATIDAGPNGYVYLAAHGPGIDDPIYVKRSTDGAVTWEEWINLTSGDDGSHGYEGYRPVVAASTEPAFPTVWVVYPYYKTGTGYNLHYAYSINAGTDWTVQQVLSANAGHEGKFHMKGYKAAPRRRLNMTYIPDTALGAQCQILWRYTSVTRPNRIWPPRIVNDFEASNGSQPLVLYSPNAPGSIQYAEESGVVYGDGYSLYFSAPWLAPTKKAVMSNVADNRVDLIKMLAVREGDGRLTSSVSIEGLSLVGNTKRVEKDPAGSDGRGITTLINMPYSAANQESSDGLEPMLSYSDGLQLSDSPPSLWIETGELANAFVINSLLRDGNSTLYAAVVESVDETRNEGAILRSADEGQSWQKRGVLNNCSAALCLLQSSDHRLFAGGMRLVENRSYGIVYRSSSDDDWDPVYTFEDGAVYDLCESRDGFIYAATGWSGKILQSDDGGDRWYLTASFGPNITVRCIMEVSDGTVLAGLERHDGGPAIMYCEAGSGSWTPVAGLSGVLAVYEITESEGNLYAAVKDNDMGGIYRADVPGHVWNPTAQFPDLDVRAAPSLCKGPKGEIFAGVEWIAGPHKTYVYLSKDEGQSWQRFGGMIAPAITTYSLLCSTDHLYAGTGYVSGDVHKCSLALVDFAEMAILASYWQSGVSSSTGDLDGDNDVDFRDVAVLCDYWLDYHPNGGLFK
jgi:hypothetical protein